jgi:hypothetical protein
MAKPPLKPHGIKITPRSFTKIQQPTKTLSQGWQFAHGVDLNGEDAHRIVTSHIDMKMLKFKASEVAKEISEANKLVKEIQRKNEKARREAPKGTEAYLAPTAARRARLKNSKVRSARLSRFLHWLKKGQKVKFGNRLRPEITTRLIAEFYTDVVTRLGSIVRED